MAVTAATTVEEILRLEAVGLATNYLENYITKQLACVAGAPPTSERVGPPPPAPRPQRPRPRMGVAAGSFVQNA